MFCQSQEMLGLASGKISSQRRPCNRANEVYGLYIYLWKDATSGLSIWGIYFLFLFTSRWKNQRFKMFFSNSGFISRLLLV